MIRLSVIIPHYNSTETLSKLLESIPVNKEIQVLVIDDHSNEQEKQKLQKIKEHCAHKNIHFLTNDPNKKGAGACRNIGLKKAVGEWVLFADSDDFFVDDFYNIVKQHFSTGFDVIFFKPTSVELDTGNVSNRHIKFANAVNDYSNTGDLKSELTLKYRVVVPWSKLIKRNVITKNKILFEEVVSSNDVMFSARLGCCIKSFGVSNETIYCVTKSKGSLTTSIDNDKFDVRLGVFVRYYHFLQEHLSKEDFKLLDLSGEGQIYKAKNYGFKKIYNVIRTLNSNKVRVVSRETLNPIRLFKKATFILSWSKKTKRFYAKN
ncbi:glycosyltransferase family 2 protein [Gracilibacillus saliphilus]|uniref:glycosyltransferase family 2 protein n=1 Tax=Gracilibacillus saliphilus TaxID=543890 RepID=UPI0013D344D7|nr:glycosyltransferase family 2 protein [Gracilibacillus saliphilus]